MLKIGIDNGVTGSIAIINDNELQLHATPTKKVINYQKKKSNVTRVDVPKLKEILEPFKGSITIVNIERPMVNPTRFAASASALRALEATLIVLEELGLGYKFVDSKEWQKKYLQEGIKGANNLKKASLERGIQMFPSLEEEIRKQGDADAIFIAFLD